MYCEQCGSFIENGESFCSNCGAPAPASASAPASAPAPAPGPEPAPGPVVQPIVQSPAQPVEPVYPQPVQPVYQSPLYQQPVQPIYQQPAYMQGGVVVTPFDRPQKNTIATIGMIFGIVTISLFWLMIFNFVPGVVGTVLSCIGLAKKNAEGKGRAIAGLVTSVLGILLGILFFAYILATDS